MWSNPAIMYYCDAHIAACVNSCLSSNIMHILSIQYSLPLSIIELLFNKNVYLHLLAEKITNIIFFL